MTKLTLISHKLCPYVQRGVIALTEKGLPFERIDIDLANKPEWFLKISPLGKTPVLLVGNTPIFESAVILEYLEDTAAPGLHPADPLARAEHRAWIEFGSAILNDIAGFYAAKDEATFDARRAALREKFVRVEGKLKGPYFDGETFSLVDTVFGPAFRYFDAFERIGDFCILDGLPKVSAWRRALAARASVQAAVAPEYPGLLWEFLRARNSHLSRQMAVSAAAA
jgi:glutathione S-transferase